MSTLTDRVSQLESMLKERGEEPPPVVYPPKTTRGTLNADGENSPTRASTQAYANSNNQDQMAFENTSPCSNPDDVGEGSVPASNASVDGQRERGEQDASQGTPIDDKKEGMLSRLLSTRGHLSFDQISGRLRYYGPTVNSHIYSELDIDDGKSSREAVEQARRAEKIIRTLPLETHDYLMSLFWQHYNGVLHVVHEDAFNEDREAGRTQFYSGFLHICILAMGYRFSDKSRQDTQRIALPDRESTLHREAKYMLDLELEHPGGIPSVAALLILGDSEVGVGRDNVGWMYAGMAMRLCYDIGLHLDNRQSGMSQREIDIRKMTMWACVIYDRYWSLFLGRPLTMKSADLEIYTLSEQFEKLGTCMPAGPAKSINTRIYEALLDLMEIAGKIVENTEHRKTHNSVQTPDQSAYFRMAALDREIHNWAAKLPAELRYTEQNRASAPYSFYLLHQQYHAVLILLHRPFARYVDENSPETEEVTALDSHFSRASRGICTKSAVAMARIFWHHRQRFDGKQIFCIGMQHAGAAATALIAALAYIPDTNDRTNNMQYLEVLQAAMQDMAHAYQPAERMAAVLNAVMIELRGGPMSPAKTFSSTSSTIPARRSSAAVDQEQERPGMKRRQTSTSRKTKPMPPPMSVRQHRASDGSNASQQTLQTTDYVMVTPRTDVSTWADLHGMENFQDQPLMATPEHSHLLLPMKRNDWMSDFPTMPSMAGLPGVSDGDSFPEFLSLPNEDDWSRWHNGPTEVAHDLDGMQFGGYT
ncbi:hypothetical protein LTR37_010019 [Vermiconidia calcicola]|uniref:Uncharacterized protein n=1 Tax=Vermiconidia calcicola TaxID=1690605 RepID=A0ACC3N773_9PEZI|nr:hypothetical protein LTR37_010019 [Vermiconidia calcicola]